MTDENERLMLEKSASRTVKGTYGRLYLLTAFIGFLSGAWIALSFSNVRLIWVCLPAGAVLGFAAGLLLVHGIKKPLAKAEKIEKSEGYTDALVEEYIRLFNNIQSDIVRKSHALTLASIYNMRGEFSKAVLILSCFNENEFFEKSSYAHGYYSQLMLAQLMNGDFDSAAETYTFGLYYMRTYMNSPISGGYVSMALAVYEFYAGHYDTALQLIDGSDRAYAAAPSKPDEKLPDENVWTINRYWQSLCLARKGMKSQAAEILKNTESTYTTEYYRSAINKLMEELSNEAIS
ncbi:MAG: hypothetical protein K2J11_11655 [Oscillospiraceae bacterium]|nr:hypothetical protein [Oscillospiraceae bacterium]